MPRMGRLPRDPRPARNLTRGRDGSLFDVDEHRQISLAELADDVRDGRRFRVRHADTDQICTQRVLLEVLQASVTPGPASSLAAGLPALASAVGTAFAQGAQENGPPRRRRSS